MKDDKFQKHIAEIGYLQHSILTELDKLMELVDKIVEENYEQRK